MTETTKPVVTQAAEWEFFRDSAYYDMWCVRMKSTRGFQDGFHLVNGDEAGALCALLNHRLAHSPSEPSVVSQDLVEDIAFMLWKGEAVRAAPNVAKNRTPNSFRSDLNEVERERWLQQARAILPIIEAAQIAARNQALEEAAIKATSFLVGDPSKGIPLRSPGPHAIADAIRSLRTPSQHQEEQ